MRYLAPAPFMKHVMEFHGGRIAGFDVGMKRIGVAMSDETHRMVFPMTTLTRGKGGDEALSRQVQRFVDENGCRGIVVGFPLLDGHATNMANEIVQLMLRVDCQTSSRRSRMSLPFTLWSEVGSTVRARRMIKGATTKRSVYSKKKDEVAAAVILERFLRNYNSGT